jgi:hypothetical protein
MARPKHKSKQARKPRGATLKTGARKGNRRPASKAARGANRSTRAGARAKSHLTKQARTKHTFIAVHHRPDAFEQGLRRYAQYRDLGIAGATKGMVRAHVIKMVPPCDPAEVSKRHFHEVDFQMVYVLKGWIKGEYEGAARGRAGCSRRRSSMPCSIIPTIASCSKSSCRQTLRPWNWSNLISPGRLFSA